MIMLATGRLLESVRSHAVGRLRWLTTLLLPVSVWVAGCVSTADVISEVSVNRLAPTGMATQETVAVILDNFSGEFSRSKENEFVGCINDAIRKKYPTVRIISPDDFRHVAVPGLTRGESPPRPWEQLMEEREIRERIAPLGIRYVILVSGATQQEEKRVYDWIAAGTTYHRESWLNAAAWDVAKAQRMGDVKVIASGKAGHGMLFPFVFVTFAYTETRACNEIGQAVQKFLAGQGM